MAEQTKIEPMGEAGLLVPFGQGISVPVNEKVLAAFEYLRSARIVGIHDLVPAYSTLLVHFSPDEVDSESLRQYLENTLLRADVPAPAKEPRQHFIPVHYGGDSGPDLDALAEAH